MRRRSSSCLLALVVAVAPAAAAEGGSTADADVVLHPDQTADEWEQSRYSAERVEARVKLFGTSYRNYFRVPDDEQETTVTSLSVEGRLTLTLHRERRIKLYLQAIREQFQDADILTSPTFSIGLRADGERHRFDTAFRYLKDREQLDIDDLAEPSDIYTYYGAYSLRFAEDWEWALEGERRDQRFPSPRQAENSELYSGSTSVRYRGWGRKFSPEIGYERRQRAAVDPHDEYEENMPWAKLRFSPHDALTVSLRYRDRSRDYAIDDPADSNFGRRDERDEWTLRADWVVARRVALNLEAEHLVTESTREGRSFTSSLVTLGTTIKVGPLPSRQPTRPAAPPAPRALEPVVAPTVALPAPAAASSPLVVDAAASPLDDATTAAPVAPPSASLPPATRPEAPLRTDTAAATAARFLPPERVRDDRDGVTFRLRVDGELRYRTFTMRDPRRAVVELEGAVCADACRTVELGGGPVIRIRSAQRTLAPQPVVRVVFDLRDPATRVEFVPEPGWVLVRLRSGGL